MKRSRIKPISDKRKKQILQEKALTYQLFGQQKGLCGECGEPLDWRAAKHEIVFRSQGGSPTDESNTILLCGKCHSKAHGIKEI